MKTLLANNIAASAKLDGEILPFKNHCFDAVLSISTIEHLPKSALEVGAGTGFHSCFISYFRINVVALDINRGVIEIARRNENHFGGKVSFVVASAFNLPFKDNCFDVCLSQGLLEHFGNNSICAFLEGLLRVGYRITLSARAKSHPIP